jgi:hypothetical protein
MGEWYKDNGVLKYRFSSKKSTTRKPPKGAYNPPASSGQSDYLRTGGEKRSSGSGGYKVTTRPYKNGTFQGWKVERKKDAIRRAAERRSSNEGNDYAKRLSDRSSTSAKRANSKRIRAQALQRTQSTPGVERESLEARRRERIKKGDFKGKYYGPDVFKGDMNKLRAWRKAGSPDPKKFARS